MMQPTGLVSPDIEQREDGVMATKTKSGLFDNKNTSFFLLSFCLYLHRGMAKTESMN